MSKKINYGFSSLAIALVLTACGGGGAGTVSTVMPLQTTGPGSTAAWPTSATAVATTAAPLNKGYYQYSYNSSNYGNNFSSLQQSYNAILQDAATTAQLEYGITSASAGSTVAVTLPTRAWSLTTSAIVAAAGSTSSSTNTYAGLYNRWNTFTPSPSAVFSFASPYTQSIFIGENVTEPNLPFVAGLCKGSVLTDALVANYAPPVLSLTALNTVNLASVQFGFPWNLNNTITDTCTAVTGANGGSSTPYLTVDASSGVATTVTLHNYPSCSTPISWNYSTVTTAMNDSTQPLTLSNVSTAPTCTAGHTITVYPAMFFAEKAKAASTLVSGSTYTITYSDYHVALAKIVDTVGGVSTNKLLVFTDIGN